MWEMEEVQMGDTQNASPHLEFKCVGVAGFKVDNPDDGVVTAIVAVTGIKDNVKDIIVPGAFEKSLATRTPKGVWHHNWHESISRTEAIKELMPGDPDLPERLPNGDPWPPEAGGLQVKTRFNLETQRGREAYSDVVFFGDDQEWSIGYNVPTGAATLDSKTGVRNIKMMELYEYSPVLFGAMPVARTSSVKEAQLAYKALFADEADHSTVVADDGPPTEEMDAVETESEEKALRRPLPMSPAQAQKLTRAISQIMDLLTDANVVEDEEDQQADVPPEDGMEQRSTGDYVADDDEEGGDELKTLVEDAFGGDADLMKAADEFEAAYAAGDGSGMEQAADPIITAVENAVNNDDQSAETFSGVTDYIVNAFDELGPDEAETGDEEEEPPAEEDKDGDGEVEESPADEEEEPKSRKVSRKEEDGTEIELKVLNLDELQDVLGD
jgi:phage head maturation protease